VSVTASRELCISFLRLARKGQLVGEARWLAISARLLTELVEDVGTVLQMAGIHSSRRHRNDRRITCARRGGAGDDAQGRKQRQDQLRQLRLRVGVWLAGETVDVSVDAGLMNIAHRSVLVATHKLNFSYWRTKAVLGGLPRTAVQSSNMLCMA